MYVCGVTPYDTTHLGHAFTFVQFDALVRSMRWLAPDREVTYVQNVTDIDDSILMRARKLGVNWRSLGDEQLELYRADMQALRVTGPKHPGAGDVSDSDHPHSDPGAARSFRGVRGRGRQRLFSSAFAARLR